MSLSDSGPVARRVVLVGSGKGGVGKSTVAVNLAVASAQAGLRVGLLDADVYGPNVPIMMGLTRRRRRAHWTLSSTDSNIPLSTVERYGVHIASVGLLFGEDQPVAWYAGLVEVLLAQLVHSTAWGDLDLLLVDLPPGTADVTQAVLRELPTAEALVVVTPQHSAHVDAKKLTAMLNEYGVPVLGAVENMAESQCPSCGHVGPAFAEVSHEHSLWATGIERWGRIPMLPVDTAPASGVPLLTQAPESTSATALREVAQRLTAPR